MLSVNWKFGKKCLTSRLSEVVSPRHDFGQVATLRNETMSEVVNRIHDFGRCSTRAKMTQCLATRTGQQESTSVACVSSAVWPMRCGILPEHVSKTNTCPVANSTLVEPKTGACCSQAHLSN